MVCPFILTMFVIHALLRLDGHIRLGVSFTGLLYIDFTSYPGPLAKSSVGFLFKVSIP